MAPNPLRRATFPLIRLKFKKKSGGAGEIRTPDKQFRKLLLYPSELQPQCTSQSSPNPAGGLGRQKYIQLPKCYVLTKVSRRGALRETFRIEVAQTLCYPS